jgi:hypothetical protein
MLVIAIIGIAAGFGMAVAFFGSLFIHLVTYSESSAYVPFLFLSLFVASFGAAFYLLSKVLL